MRTPKTSIKSKHSFAVLATAIILLAVPAGASAQGKKIPIDPPTTPTTEPTTPPQPQPGTGTVRDHRPPPTVVDDRKVRDHRTQTEPVQGGGVTVTSVPRKPKPQPGYNPVPGHY